MLGTSAEIRFEPLMDTARHAQVGCHTSEQDGVVNRVKGSWQIKQNQKHTFPVAKNMVDVV